MNLEIAKEKAREQIRTLAGGDKEKENNMLSGMLILEDAINGDI